MFLGVFLCSCKREKSYTSPNENFAQTWYAGKAELTSYTLEQARYGEVRRGEAVLIFVTEDFSNDQLIKLDEPDKTSDKTKVLKLNLTKSFVTGVYPYSMMLCVFTPVSASGNETALKITSSVQEWCGQTYSSLKMKGGNYDWRLYSYFEKEGEQNETVGDAFAEDGIWTGIRMNPNTLPQGKVKLLPGLLWQRLSHTTMQAEEAEATLTKADTSFIKEAAQVYTVHYPSLNRTLRIYFTAAAPYQILGWQESYPDGFGPNKKMLTTTAKRKATIWSDYWSHNRLSDSTYRDSLQLAPHGYEQ